MSEISAASRPNQPLRPALRRRAAGTGPAWPSYSGTAQHVGSSSIGVTVYVDPSLGAPAAQNAQDLLGAADRVVAQNNAIFATAPQWATDGMANWVESTASTDQDPDSTGCGMAFLSWLLSQQHSLPQIAQAMVALGDTGTLAQLYAQLTGNSADTAWANFTADLNRLPAGITTDDPFNGFPNAAVPT